MIEQQHTTEDPLVEIASVGIDLGKNTFHMVALDAKGKVLLRKKFSRTQLLAYTANLQRSLIGMEACAGAHFIGAALRDQGHNVRLIPGQFVKPFVKTNKNDFVDAEAIAEAVARENMRFVPIKTDDQLDLQALHRVRDRLVQRRTALTNQIRGFMLERGIACTRGRISLRNEMPSILEDATRNLTPMLRNLLEQLWQEWKQLQTDIERISDEIARISEEDTACKRLRQIPGVGPLVATAMVAAIGNGAAFHKGGSFRPSSDWCPDSTQPAERLGYSGSASAATRICVACSSTAPAPCCCVSSMTLADSGDGCINSPPARRAIR
jgi:transposase